MKRMQLTLQTKERIINNNPIQLTFRRLRVYTYNLKLCGLFIFQYILLKIRILFVKIVADFTEN